MAENPDTVSFLKVGAKNLFYETKKLLTGFIPFVFSTLLIFSGCTKNKSKENCFNCNPALPESQKIVSIENQSVTIGIYKKTPFSNLVLSKVQNESPETATLFQNLITSLDNSNSFESILSERYVPVNYNIYIKKSIREESQITRSDIIGISIIMYKEFGLHHFLFKNDGSDIFIINNKFSAITDGLNIKDQYLIFEKLFNVDNNITYSLITTVTPPYNDVMNKIKTKNELRTLLKDEAGFNCNS